ncbi:MFS general substrate transporter [Multifurca ochricompacta]|uniref:MFS general substrate transporter n=1 Tax=Multifurca ochricompacta TaxID=376703 RepID=A0AAD4QPY7_9AGAM|nr:MFS general substrate transporter [Multifurca ochricompacta]
MSGKPTEKCGRSSDADNTVHEYYPSPSPAPVGYLSGSSFAEDTTSQYPEYHDDHVRPTGLKGFFYNPYTQVVLLGFVCFLCPSLFNALNGLGAGGQIDGTTSANANSTLYATFALAAFFAGSINNILGPRLTLFLGSFGYAIYIGSYLAVNIHNKAGGFVIAAGAVLGLCAGMLWTAQGSLMLAYPTENQKGKFIGIFWSIFNLGGVVGASVSLGQNSHSEVFSNGTYIGFMILAGMGALVPLFMANPEKMIRTDGTKVTTPRQPSWRTEIYGLYIALRTDPLIVLLFPMFFASNWFYTWQFNDYNAALFNIRARSLNNLVYWVSQILGSVSIGLLLDQSQYPRRARAFAGWSILLIFVLIVHIWGFFYQRTYTRQSMPPDASKMDINDKGYIGRLFLYIFCGLLDSMWQTTAYWMMGAMSNDPAKLAYFAGFYKSIQSAGAAGVWRADAMKVPYMNLFLSTWALLIAGLVFSLPMIHLRVKDHTDVEDEVLARMEEMHNVLPTESDRRH